MGLPAGWLDIPKQEEDQVIEGNRKAPLIARRLCGTLPKKTKKREVVWWRGVGFAKTPLQTALVACSRSTTSLHDDDTTTANPGRRSIGSESSRTYTRAQKARSCVFCSVPLLLVGSHPRTGSFFVVEEGANSELQFALLLPSHHSLHKKRRGACHTETLKKLIRHRLSACRESVISSLHDDEHQLRQPTRVPLDARQIA